jgi:DNA-binding transcriptional LysR family regulator
VNARQLEVFEAVMRSGSVGDAARALGVSQPAVTKSLRVAEQAAGFVLFRRLRGRLYPSPEAETLLPEVQRIRRDLGAVSLLLRQLRDGNAGSVTVACTASLAQFLLTPALARFRRERPGIRIEVRILPSASVIDTVAHSRADFGLVYYPTDNLYVDGEVLYVGEAIAVMPTRHRLAAHRTVAARELADSPLITFPEETGIGWLVRQSLQAADPRREVDIVVNQSQHALQLVEAGCGVAVIDPFLMLGGPRRGLTARPFRPSIPLRLSIVRARERPRSRAAAQLATEVRAIVAALPAVRPADLIQDGGRRARAGRRPRGPVLVTERRAGQRAIRVR